MPHPAQGEAESLEVGHPAGARHAEKRMADHAELATEQRRIADARTAIDTVLERSLSGAIAHAGEGTQSGAADRGRYAYARGDYHQTAVLAQSMLEDEPQKRDVAGFLKEQARAIGRCRLSQIRKSRYHVEVA